MKNTTLNVTFNTDKIDALTFHMGKKDANLQTELTETIQKLYEKYVPANVREYIDEREDEEIKPEKPKKPAKVATDSRNHITAQNEQE